MPENFEEPIWTEVSSYRGNHIPADGIDRVSYEFPSDSGHLKVDAEGSWMIYGGEHFAASVADLTFSSDFHEYLTCSGRVSFQFILDGDFDFSLVDRGRYCLSGGRALVFVCPPGTRMERAMSKGHAKYIGLVIPLAKLLETFDLQEADLRPEIRPIIAGQAQEPLALGFQISPAQRDAIFGLFDNKIDGRVGNLFTYAKLMELACLSLPWLTRGGPAGNPVPCMYDRQSYALEKAVHMLDAKRGDHVSVRQLSRQVGLNRNKLSAGFRNRFGTTPARFALSARLQHARDLLSSSDLSIFEIAVEIGYANQSSFSRAFRREFGCTPREMRNFAD